MICSRGRRAHVPAVSGCVATIGNFDGMHLGHQALLHRVKAVAAERALASQVLLFEPHPQEFFSATPPPRLMTLREKLDFLRAQGIDRVLVLRFDSALANMSAQAFIDQILVERLAIQHLVIGDDFRFGHARQGDYALLATQPSFGVESSASVLQADIRVSSTSVREALSQRDFALAAQRLGRAFAISGIVAHGDKKGRLLGFPTANLRLHRHSLPLRGVYAVRLHWREQVLNGVANIGFRPTLNGAEARLETHLFDFAGDLYGERISVEPLHFIRDEMKFSGLEALRAQIDTDARIAREFFAGQFSAEQFSAE